MVQARDLRGVAPRSRDRRPADRDLRRERLEEFAPDLNGPAKPLRLNLGDVRLCGAGARIGEGARAGSARGANTAQARPSGRGRGENRRGRPGGARALVAGGAGGRRGPGRGSARAAWARRVPARAAARARRGAPILPRRGPRGAARRLAPAGPSRWRRAGGCGVPSSARAECTRPIISYTSRAASRSPTAAASFSHPAAPASGLGYPGADARARGVAWRSPLPAAPTAGGCSSPRRGGCASRRLRVERRADRPLPPRSPGGPVPCPASRRAAHHDRSGRKLSRLVSGAAVALGTNKRPSNVSTSVHARARASRAQRTPADGST